PLAGPLGGAALGASAGQLGGLARQFVEAMSELKAGRAYEGMADIHERLEAEGLAGKLDAMKDFMIEAFSIMGNAEVEEKRRLIASISVNLARREEPAGGQVEALYAIHLIGEMPAYVAALFAYLAQEVSGGPRTEMDIPRDRP